MVGQVWIADSNGVYEPIPPCQVHGEAGITGMASRCPAHPHTPDTGGSSSSSWAGPPAGAWQTWAAPRFPTTTASHEGSSLSFSSWQQDSLAVIHDRVPLVSLSFSSWQQDSLTMTEFLFVFFLLTTRLPIHHLWQSSSCVFVFFLLTTRLPIHHLWQSSSCVCLFHHICYLWVLEVSYYFTDNRHFSVLISDDGQLSVVITFSRPSSADVFHNSNSNG